MNYDRKLQELLTYCASVGTHVKFVGKDTLKDYMGMNSEAAKIMDFPMNESSVYIYKNANDRDKYFTLVHELCEMQLIRDGYSYWDAHKKSLKLETKI